MVTALYAIPLTIIFLALSARVITYRRANKLGLGDHGDKSLMKRMRAQANCAEYAPFGVVLMLLVELQAPASVMVHVIGILLVAGRLAHGYGFSASPPVMGLRVGGMILTLTSFLIAIVSLAVLGLAPA